MFERPSLWKIIQGDPVILRVVSPILFLTFITAFSFFTQNAPGDAKIESAPFVTMLGISLLVLGVVTYYRVGKVNEFFDSGAEVTAEIDSVKTFRANMTLQLRYSYMGQAYEKKYDQTITMKNKHFLKLKQISLLINRDDPKKFLLKDAYR